VVRHRLSRPSLHFVCVRSYLTYTSPTQIYTPSLHDALPIFGEYQVAAPGGGIRADSPRRGSQGHCLSRRRRRGGTSPVGTRRSRSEEHTSELQSPDHLVCRLLLEKKKKSPLYTNAIMNSYHL